MGMGEVELLHRNPPVAAVNRILDDVHNDAGPSLACSHDRIDQVPATIF